jgi:hypothetical protein
MQKYSFFLFFFFLGGEIPQLGNFFPEKEKKNNNFFLATSRPRHFLGACNNTFVKILGPTMTIGI